MKKLVLVLVLVLAFALPVLANPFADVPLNHWAYDAVDYLAAKGIVIGYPDGTFGGNRMLTRYEFAEAIARVVARFEDADFASAEDVAILEKLAIEFADELASLGVTVADLEAAVGANSAAIAALEAKVARYDYFFEPLKITGDFTASYKKVVVPMTLATLTDDTNINIEATINDETTAGISVEVEDIFGGTPVVTWGSFFIDYQGADLQLRVGEVEPATIGLGLVYDSDAFDGFLATWIWDKENTNLGNWTLFGDVEDYYTLNIGFALGDKDEVAVGVTGSYDVLAAGYAGGADLAFNLGDEVAVTVEGAVFYDVALSYAAAVSIDSTIDSLALGIDAHYVLPGFVPTMSGFTADRLGGYVEAKYPFTDQVTGKVRYTHELDSAMVDTVTSKVRGTLLYVPEDAAAGEKAEVYAEYDVLTGNTTARAKYMNYPLADDFVLSGIVAYDFPAATYAGAATLEYALATDMTLTVEGRVDSDSAAFWSAEVQLVYALAANTDLTVGYEQNTWSAMTISDTLGTLTAELAVSF